MIYRRQALKYILCVFLCFSTNFILADTEKLRIIHELASSYPEDKTFYRWQSKASGETLLSAGTFNDKLYAYFMGMNIDPVTMVAGHGIYVAENPYSSSQFIRGGGEGSLIEVQLKKGTKYLDLTDSKTLENLKAQGISKEEVLKLNPNLAIKYNNTDKWWVLKSQSGVSFKTFEGENLMSSYLLDVIERISESKPRAIYMDELHRILQRKISDDPSILRDPRLSLIYTPDEIMNLTIGKVSFNSPSEVLNNIEKIRKTNYLNTYLKNPSRRMILFEGMHQHLDVAKMFEVSAAFGLKERGDFIDYLSKNADPKKYYNYISLLKSNSFSSIDKYVLGPIKTSSVDSGMSNDLKEKISEVIDRFNLSPAQRESVSKEFTEIQRIKRIQTPQEFFSFIDAFMITRESPIDANSVKAFEILIDHFLGLNPSNAELLRFIKLAKEREFPIVVFKLGALSGAAKDAATYLHIIEDVIQGNSKAAVIPQNILSSIDHFLGLNPTTDELLQLAKLFESNKWRWLGPKLPQVLMKAQTPEAYLKLSSVFTSLASYREGSEAVSETVEHFLKLGPSNKEVEALFTSAYDKMGLWAVKKAPPFLKNTKTAEDFVALAKKVSALDIRYNGQEISKAFSESIDHFISLEPNQKALIDFTAFGKSKSYTWILDFSDRLLIQTKSPSAYLELAGQIASLNTGQHSKEVQLAISKSLNHFLGMNPPYESLLNLMKHAKNGNWNWIMVHSDQILAQAKSGDEFARLLDDLLSLNPSYDDVIKLFKQVKGQNRLWLLDYGGKLLKRSRTALNYTNLLRELSMLNTGNENGHIKKLLDATYAHFKELAPKTNHLEIVLDVAKGVNWEGHLDDAKWVLSKARFPADFNSLLKGFPNSSLESKNGALLEALKTEGRRFFSLSPSSLETKVFFETANAIGIDLYKDILPVKTLSEELSLIEKNPHIKIYKLETGVIQIKTLTDLREFNKALISSANSVEELEEASKYIVNKKNFQFQNADLKPLTVETKELVRNRAASLGLTPEQTNEILKTPGLACGLNLSGALTFLKRKFGL